METFLTEIYVNCDSAAKEPLFMELVNESLLENLTKEMYTVPQCSPTCTMNLSKDEENIIRYACGYVGMKLYNRFVKQPGEKAAAFVECTRSETVLSQNCLTVGLSLRPPFEC